MALPVPSRRWLVRAALAEPDGTRISSCDRALAIDFEQIFPPASWNG